MYNNPFMYQNLYRPSFISRLFSNGFGTRAISRSINWGNILSNTQKGLGIINQAIPLVYQVKPIINNAKTMFKIADALKDPSSSINTVTNLSNDNKTKNNEYNENKPIFYV